MKYTNTNKLTFTILLASFMFIALPASAGKDDIQSRMSQQVYKLQQQARAAQASQQDSATGKVAECKRLMGQGKNC